MQAAQPHHDAVTYWVNGEQQTTSSETLSVATILADAGFTPPENYDLERDGDPHPFKNQQEHVKITPDERFTATFKGPTPTS
jgi:hypothetical protein